MPFRDLVRVSTPLFLPLGLLARLPQSMTPLAILLLVSAAPAIARWPVTPLPRRALPR
jgi:hypothetical protein